jgi:beta-lactamase superfamily II metal-dependent hydrolase
MRRNVAGSSCVVDVKSCELRKNRTLVASAWSWLLLLGFYCRASGQIVGEPLPPWTAGTLDIHQIQTGRGNATYFGLEQGPARPDGTRSPGDWIAHYIAQVSRRSTDTLDYAVITHYHDDHMGAIADVARSIAIATLIDRGDQPPPPSGPLVARYLEFRKTQKSEVLAPWM